jgi:hypothetical protein
MADATQPGMTDTPYAAMNTTDLRAFQRLPNVLNLFRATLGTTMRPLVAMLLAAL